MEEIMKLKEMLPDMEPAEISILMKKLLDLSDAVYRQYENRSSEASTCICEIPIDQIDPFPDHPFYMNDDEDMMDLAGSIAVNGLLVPASVRRMPDGRYEMLSGHRRMRACQIAGLSKMRCEVLSLDDARATVFVVEANRQRTKLYPGEKAFAFEMRQWAATKYMSELFSEGVGSFDRIDNAFGNREYQVQRCIRLTELIPELLEMVDKGEMALRPALELAYLPKRKQGKEWMCMEHVGCTPSHAQAVRMRKLEGQHKLTTEAIEEILSELKPNQKPKIAFTERQLSGCIPEDIPADKRKEYVINALKVFSQLRRTI